jgi:hypothetical protein
MVVISRPYEYSRDVIVTADGRHASHITRLFASALFSR